MCEPSWGSAAHIRGGLLLFLLVASGCHGSRLDQATQEDTPEPVGTGWNKCADKATSLHQNYCECTGMVRYGGPINDEWLPEVYSNVSLLCSSSNFGGGSLTTNENLECQCYTPPQTTTAAETTTATETTTTPVPTTPVPTPSTPPPTSTSPAPSTTSTTPAPTTSTTPATTPTVTNATNVTTVTTTPVSSKRKLMDSKAVKAMADTATMVVCAVLATTVVTTVVTSSSGPGAVALLSEVQTLSQLGKVGGGGGALREFSDNFQWSKLELPFSLIPDGNEPEASTSPVSARSARHPVGSNDLHSNLRRWVDNTRRSLRRGKRPIPEVGQNVEMQDNSQCQGDLEVLPPEVKAKCLECGLVDGVPLLDKLFIIAGSFTAVFCVRAFTQYVWTECLKKEKMTMLMFPNWEGPLLLVHWFGMCEALAVTMGRPCPTWYGLAAAIVFFGPILFMLYCIFKITRMIRRQEIEFIEHDPYPWSDCRAEMNKRGVCGKAKLLYKFYTHKRHKGDWELKDDKGMFWHFLLKDFTGKTWKYCLWILLRKLMLAGAMALTLGMANSVSVILLQVLDLLYLWFSFPNEDQISNIAQVMCAKCNLLTMILASLPLFTPEMPEWLSDFTLICCALGGTALSALNALLAPIAALCGLIWEGLGGLYNLVVKPISSLCAPCMQGVNQGMGEGLVSAAAAGVTDAAVEIAVDACEIGDGDEEGDENANSSDSNEGEALGVAVAAGAVGAGAVMGAGMISKARKTPSYDPDDPPAHVQLKLVIDFKEAGEERSMERAEFEQALVQDLSQASGVPEDCFVVRDVSPGSIIVQVSIYKDESGPSPSAVLFFLQHELRQAESTLRKGRFTRHLESIDLLEQEPGREYDNNEAMSGKKPGTSRGRGSVESRKSSLSSDDVVVHLVSRASARKHKDGDGKSPEHRENDGLVKLRSSLTFEEQPAGSGAVTPAESPRRDNFNETEHQMPMQMSRSVWLDQLDRAHRVMQELTQRSALRTESQLRPGMPFSSRSSAPQLR